MELIIFILTYLNFSGNNGHKMLSEERRTWNNALYKYSNAYKQTNRLGWHIILLLLLLLSFINVDSTSCRRATNINERAEETNLMIIDSNNNNENNNNHRLSG